MHIVVLPLVMVAIIATVLGVFSASVDRSVDVTETSLDTIDKVAAKKNEVLQASINAKRDKVEIDNHSTEPVEILFVEHGFEKDGDTKRVSLHDNVQGTCEAGDKAKPLTIDPRNPQAFNPEDYLCKNEKRKAADLKTLSMTTVNGNKFEIRLTADVGEIVDALEAVDPGLDPICDTTDIKRYNSDECEKKYGTPLKSIQTKIVEKSEKVSEIDSRIDKLEERLGDGDAQGEGSGNATAVINGMGLNSRIIHNDYAGSIIYGVGLVGKESSVQPYMDIDPMTDFIIGSINDEDATRYVIPEFYNTYELSSGSLAKGGEYENVLKATNTINIGDGVSSTISDDGLTVSGEGRVIFELKGNAVEDHVFIGSLSEGSTARLVTSPYNLVDLPLDDNGFLLYESNRNLPPIICNAYETENARALEQACDLHDLWLRNPTGYKTSFSLLVGSTDDSNKKAVFSYDIKGGYNVFKWLPREGGGPRPQSDTWYVSLNERIVSNPVLHIRDHAEGYREVIGDEYAREASTDKRGLGLYQFQRHPGETEPSGDVHLKNNPFYSSNKWRHSTSNLNYKIYDSLPVRELHAMNGKFEEIASIPTGISYLVVDSNGGSSNISASTLETRPYFVATSLPPDIGYKIVKEGITTVSGLTSPDGKIQLDVSPGFKSDGNNGFLYLFENSLTLTGGGFETLIFDYLNGHIIEIKGDTRMYNVHGYVKVPITGDVEVSNAMVGVLRLDYLNSRYNSGEEIYFPIIPPHKEINMDVGNVGVSDDKKLSAPIEIADVLGATGLKIAEPVSNRITSGDLNGFIEEVEATAGFVSYMIAATDGTAKALVEATVHAKSEIYNERFYERQPPEPCQPRAGDPLTTWIEVYVNGELRAVDGKEKHQIYFSDEPDENHDCGRTLKSNYHDVRFSYDPVSVSKVISLQVEEGDFIEFYFYSKVYAQGSIPESFVSFTDFAKRGSGLAESHIDFASINMSL